MLKPGDIVGERFEIVGGPVAIMGRDDCTSMSCTRTGDGKGGSRCVGYHCPLCGESCGMTGHKACREKADEDDA